MPELPEVEAARRLLAHWTVGRRILRVATPDEAVVREVLRAALDGAAPAAPIRHGKRLGWAFDGPEGQTALLVHLGMTGRWARRTGEEPPRFGRLGLHMDDGSAVWFVDARRFGCVAFT